MWRQFARCMSVGCGDYMVLYTHLHTSPLLVSTQPGPRGLKWAGPAGPLHSYLPHSQAGGWGPQTWRLGGGGVIMVVGGVLQRLICEQRWVDQERLITCGRWNMMVTLTYFILTKWLFVRGHQNNLQFIVLWVSSRVLQFMSLNILYLTVCCPVAEMVECWPHD